MRILIRVTTLLLMTAIPFITVAQNVNKVLVFTNHNQTIIAPKSLYDKGIITIHNVDEFVDAETSLNTLLEAQAKKLTTPNIYANMNEKQLMDLYQKAYHKAAKRPQYAQIITQLETSSLGLVQLQAYDIKALPAIVVNDQVVIYGYSNIGDALDLFQQYKGESK